MDLQITLPALAAVVGLMLYLLPLPPKAQEIGRLLFTVAMLVFLWRAR